MRGVAEDRSTHEHPGRLTSYWHTRCYFVLSPLPINASDVRKISSALHDCMRFMSRIVGELVSGAAAVRNGSRRCVTKTTPAIGITVASGSQTLERVVDCKPLALPRFAYSTTRLLVCTSLSRTTCTRRPRTPMPTWPPLPISASAPAAHDMPKT